MRRLCWMKPRILYSLSRTCALVVCVALLLVVASYSRLGSEIPVQEGIIPGSAFTSAAGVRPSEEPKSGRISLPAEVVQLLKLAEANDVQLVLVDQAILECLGSGRSQCSTANNRSVYSFADFHSGHTLPLQFIKDLKDKHSWKCSTTNYSRDLKPSLTTCQQHILKVHLLSTRSKENYWLLPSVDDESAQNAFLPTELAELPLQSEYKLKLLVPRDPGFFAWQWPRSKFMSCLKHSELKTPSHAMQSTVDQLAYLRDLLYRWHMDPLLTFGTLLGWYRDCGFIAYDTDFDLRVDARDYNPNIEKCLMHDRVINLRRIYGYLNSSRGFQLLLGSMKVDLYVTYTVNGQEKVPFVTALHEESAHLPTSTGICSVDFLGHLFHAPCNAEDFIAADYGKDWKTPHHYEFGEYLGSNVAHDGLLSLPNVMALYFNYFPRLQRYVESMFSSDAQCF